MLIDICQKEIMQRMEHINVEKEKDDIKRFEPVFGKWYIVQKIGQGSYGTVYKIYKEENGEKEYSALKHIHIGPNPSSDLLLERQDASRYFRSIYIDALNRINLVRSLKGHPNIVPIEEFESIPSENECCWDILIRMELLTPIEKYYAKDPPSEEDIRKLGIDICSALEACESKSIAHLDVKPNNTYINELGDYMLGDFGIARIINGKRNQTTVMLNNLNAAVPEDIHMSNLRLLREDQYSLGMMLYRYLNDNKAPFVSYDEVLYTYSMLVGAARRRLSGEKIPPPRDASPAFAEVILRSMAHSPAERFSSATEMKSALEGIGHVSNEPLWTKKSRVSYTIQGDDEFSSPSKDCKARGAEYAAGRTEVDSINGKVSNFKKHRAHRIGFNGRASKRIQRLINWVLFTCLLSLIPLFVFLLLRWISATDIPVQEKLAIELLYLSLTLAIVTLRELIRYDFKKKQSFVLQPALWLTIIVFAFSAMLFSIMTASELRLFIVGPAQSTRMLLAAAILSGTSFVLGAAIQYWEEC